MRTSKFFKTGLLLFVASLGLISCGDDDKEPEIVVDPVSNSSLNFPGPKRPWQ